MVVVVAMAATGFAMPASAVPPADAPELLAPAYSDQSTGEPVTGNPVLRWSAVASAAKYRVQVSSTSTFSPLLFTVDTFNLQATPVADLPARPALLAGCRDGRHTNRGRAVRRLDVLKRAAAQPLLIAPEDGAELAYPAVTPVLRWSPMSGVKSYRVELDDAADFIGATVVTTANTSLALAAPLILDKDYHWRVQGVSATVGVTTEFSPAWRFRTTWPAVGGAPVLRSPVGGTTVDVTDVVFRWNPVNGAKNYQIQVSPNEDFANNSTDDRIVKGTAYSPTNTYDNATYFWRVRAQDTGTVAHPGPWSATGQFKRSWLPQPTPISPVAAPPCRRRRTVRMDRDRHTRAPTSCRSPSTRTSARSPPGAPRSTPRSR